ncbi:MAG TPA: ABC transporter permease [Vicinamibacterales bacterium]|nr:ABC transporter permease [Vicinamibacterales bacterium]
MMESLATEVRRAARRLCHSPGFAAVTVVTLALGIGASTAMFSTVRPVLLEAVPYPNASRLVTVADTSRDTGTALDVTFGTFREIMARSRAIARAAVTRSWQPTLSGVGDAERLDGQSVSADYFRVLGVEPALGRDFVASDDVPGAAPIAIISSGLWRRRLGGDPTIVGRTVRLDGAAVTIVGVMGDTFENVWNPAARIWRPLRDDPSLPLQGREWGHNLQMLARLQPESDVDALRHELTSIAATPLAAFARPDWASLSGGLIVTSMQDQVTANVKPALREVTIATLLLLLIAAVNVMNLMLARGNERRAELETRTALGAPRMQLITPLLTEGLLLSIAGGVLGMTVAYAMVDALVSMDGVSLPRASAIHLDSIALAFAAVLTASIGVLTSCVPAVWLWRRASATPAASRVITRPHRLRSVFATAEVALALVLLVGAGLLLRSVERLLSVSAGFRPEGVLTLQVQTSGPQFRGDDEVRRFFDRVQSTLQEVNGVAAVGLTSQLPLSGDMDEYGVGLRNTVTGLSDPAESAFRYAITPGYLTAMSIPIVSGRDVDERDRNGEPVALISASLARRRFGDVNPIGRQVRVGAGDNWYTVVGIAGDVKQSSLAAASADAIYMPEWHWRFADRAMWIVVRTSADPSTIEPDVRRAINAVDPNQPIVRVATMRDRVAASAARQRFVMTAFDTFAVIALILAIIGIYGVLAGGVIERTREIALRSAVGATRTSIISLIVRQAVGIAAAGLIAGLIGAVFVSQGLSTLLFEISPLDAITYGIVGVLLLGASVISATLPAWRAARISPSVALQSY